MGGTGKLSRGQAIAYAAAAVLVVVALASYLGDDDDETAAPVAIERESSEPAAREGGRRLYVHVAGAVHEEGLYRMEPGSRVGAAIGRAGGTRPSADLAGVNLAAELQDGQQVVVPKRGAVPSTAAAASTAAGAPDAPVSLAQATPEQLDATVDGIGPVLAGAIVEFRDENGGVGSIDELREVDGIGEERLATLREALVP